MKYAIIRTGGKQYRVAEGDDVFVEKLEVEDKVEFTEVLAVNDGESLKVGKPIVDGAKVLGEVVKQGRGKKIKVFKYKSKKGYRRTQGHRQPYTRVHITEIVG